MLSERDPFSRSLITTFSPKTVGSVETLRSTSRKPCFMVNRPSWGRRLSAMSMFDMILIREPMAICKAFAGEMTSWSTPSIR